jgi:hypothetical protein
MDKKTIYAAGAVALNIALSSWSTARSPTQDNHGVPLALGTIGVLVLGDYFARRYEREQNGSRGVQHRPLYQIHDEIRRDWKKVHYAAVPYLEAMRYLDKVTDSFMNESGRSVVTYFLSNASSWKGEVAKRVKAELRAML